MLEAAKVVLDTVIFNHKIGIAWFSIGNNILICSYIYVMGTPQGC
jgi:hypothetical protein